MVKSNLIEKNKEVVKKMEESKRLEKKLAEERRVERASVVSDQLIETFFKNAESSDLPFLPFWFDVISPLTFPTIHSFRESISDKSKKRLAENNLQLIYVRDVETKGFDVFLGSKFDKFWIQWLPDIIAILTISSFIYLVISIIAKFPYIPFVPIFRVIYFGILLRILLAISEKYISRLKRKSSRYSRLLDCTKC